MSDVQLILCGNAGAAALHRAAAVSEDAQDITPRHVGARINFN